MKDWDHIEWKENQKARKASTSGNVPARRQTAKGGGDGERAKKREQEEGTKNRDADTSWYGTTT